MTNVICIGSAGKDIFFPTDGGLIIDTPEDIMSQKKIAFEMGAKYDIADRCESLGGCAANVACGLRRLGVENQCYSITGDDMVGEWVLGEMKKERVGLSLMERLQKSKTDLAAIIVDSRTGDRLIFTNRKANKKFVVDPENISDAEWIFIGDLSDTWKECTDTILKVAETNNAKLAINPREKAIHEDVKKIINVIRRCYFLVVNKDEAIEIILGENEKAVAEDLNDPTYLAKQLRDLGPEIVAVTDGKNGAWAYDGEILIHSKARGLKPIDSTGAGDAFASGFLAALIKGSNMIECLKWGIANSGNSVGYYGAIEGLLHENEIMDHVLDIEVEKC